MSPRGRLDQHLDKEGISAHSFFTVAYFWQLAEEGAPEAREVDYIIIEEDYESYMEDINTEPPVYVLQLLEFMQMKGN